MMSIIIIFVNLKNIFKFKQLSIQIKFSFKLSSWFYKINKVF